MGEKKTQFLAGLAGKGRVTPTLIEVKIFSRGRSIKTLFIFGDFSSAGAFQGLFTVN